MSNLNQFFGGDAPVTSIVNSYSGGGYSASQITSATATAVGIKTVLSGALTANTLATALSITGAGYLDYFAATSVDTTARTHRVKITLDGVVVFDATTDSVVLANSGILATGMRLVSATGPIQANIRFRESCLVQYASSLTETDKSNIMYSYRLTEF